MFKNYNKIIPLGDTCYVAKYIHSIGRRQEAYPFDWLISNISFITYLLDNSNIEEKLDSIFKSENLVIRKSNKKNHIVYLYNIYKNIKYGYISKIRFYHDFYTYNNIQNQINNVKNKYKRRFKRLNNVLEDNTQSKILTVWTQRFKIDEYKRLGNILIGQNIINFNFLIIISKTIFKRLKVNFEFKKNYLYGSILGKINYKDYSIYILSYSNIHLLKQSLNKLFL